MIDAAGLFKKAMARAPGLGLGARIGGDSKAKSDTGLSPIAIDFGASGLKASQIVDGARVSALALAPTPEEFRLDPSSRLAWQGETLKAWAKDGVFKGRRAVCGIPGALVTVRHLQLDNLPGLDLSSAAKHAMSEHLGCMPDQIVHRCVEVGPVLAGTASGGSPRTEMISIAASRSDVEQLVGVLRSAGLDPVGMHAPGLAIARAFGSACDAEAPVMVVDLGAQQTTAVVVDQSKPTVMRVFPVGGDTIDEGIGAMLRVPASAVRRAREATGVVTTARVRAQLESDATASAELGLAPASEAPSGCAARPIVTDLADELGAALRYHRGLFPGRSVRRVIFTGGGASGMELCRLVAERLGLAAQIGDPIAAMPREEAVRCEGMDGSDATPGWAVSAGLALSPTDL